MAAQEIIRRSVDANEKDWNAAPAYAHQERDVDAKGEEKTDRTWDVFQMDGSPYRRLLASEGHPLSTARQRQEEQKEKRELARRRSESPEERQARIRKYQKERDQDHLLMTQMQVAFNFRLVGDATLSGHPVYVLDAQPRPDYRPANHEAKVLLGMKGTLWVDKAEFHWAKVEAEVVRPVTFGGFLAKVGPGTKFLLEKEPVGDRIWQPKRFFVNVVASVLFWEHDSTSEETFMDYHPSAAISSMPRRESDSHRGLHLPQLTLQLRQPLFDLLLRFAPLDDHLAIAP